MAFVTPVVEHWLQREIAQWVHPMKDRSDNPSHHERTLLPRSYISLPFLNSYIGIRNTFIRWHPVAHWLGSSEYHTHFVTSSIEPTYLSYTIYMYSKHCIWSIHWGDNSCTMIHSLIMAPDCLFISHHNYTTTLKYSELKHKVMYSSNLPLTIFFP